MQEIDQRVREIIWQVSEDKEKRKQIFEEEISDVAEEIGFDSLQIVSFILMLEEEFGVTFEDSEAIEKVWNYKSLIEWLEMEKK